MQQIKILNKLTDHFEDNRTLACITAGLFALGILVFIINNTVLFFVDAKAYFWPRLCMKGVTDICWVAGAVLGTKYYPTKRNNLLMPTLIFYFLGDIAVLFSVPAAAPPSHCSLASRAVRASDLHLLCHCTSFLPVAVPSLDEPAASSHPTESHA